MKTKINRIRYNQELLKTGKRGRPRKTSQTEKISGSAIRTP
ncbi:MAG: hypothetical protein D3918_00710 [Candidatus Electrothrix sp. AX2]|nr:hypothetical protein [Candidatus Electrothrix gigas]